MCVCVCVYVCVFASNISVDQDQTDLRVSTWLLRGSMVCKVFGLLINNFINALQICEHRPPEPPQSRAHQSQSMQSPPRPPTLRNKRIYTCSGASWTGILLAVWSRYVLFCVSKLTVVDYYYYETKRVRTETVRV